MERGYIKFFAGLEGTEAVAISELYDDLVMKSKESAEEIGKGNRHKNSKPYHGGEDR